MTASSDVVRHQRFGGPFCLHLHPWRRWQHDPPKRWCPTSLLDIMTQKTTT